MANVTLPKLPNLPENYYSFIEGTYDCKIGEAGILSGSSFFEIAEYDTYLVQQLVVAVLSFGVNLLTLYYYATHKVHPKFCMRPVRRWCLIIHIVTGTLEIFVGPAVSWFVEGEAVVYLITAQGGLSVIHGLTALYQTPESFGVHIFMLPGYFYVAVLKIIVAVNLILNPYCYVRSLVLFNILSVYPWTKLYIVIFNRLSIFKDSGYSVALLVACGTCLPGVGPANLLFLLMWILFYAWSMRLYYGSESYKFLHQLGESSSNPFDNSAFKALFIEAGGYSFSSDDTEGNTERTEAILRPLFHQLDSDGNGYITVPEMKQFALNVKQPRLYKAILRALYHSKSHKGEKIPKMDYLEFRRLAQGIAFGHQVQGITSRIEEIRRTTNTEAREMAEAKLVFDVFDREVNGYLSFSEVGLVLMEFGLNATEVKSIFKKYDANKDGKLEFEEFEKSFKPLWSYAFNEFQKRLDDEKRVHDRRSMVKLTSGRLLADQKKKYLEDSQRLSLKTEKKTE